MNKYIIPKSLYGRLKIIDFTPNPLYRFHRYRVTMETIYVALVLDNLVPCEGHVIEHILNKKDQWRRDFHADCNCLKVS